MDWRGRAFFEAILQMITEGDSRDAGMRRGCLCQYGLTWDREKGSEALALGAGMPA